MNTPRTTPPRRAVLQQLGGLAAAALVPGVALAQAGKFTMKIAISIPDSHPTTAALKAACAEILKESAGRLTIDVYPTGQLGSDTDTVSQVRSGAIDFVCTANQIWGNLVPVISINTLAFAFPDYATVWKAMDGELGAHIRSACDRVLTAPLEQIRAEWAQAVQPVFATAPRMPSSSRATPAKPLRAALPSGTAESTKTRRKAT